MKSSIYTKMFIVYRVEREENSIATAKRTPLRIIEAKDRVEAGRIFIEEGGSRDGHAIALLSNVKALGDVV